MPSMHEYDDETDALVRAILKGVQSRIANPVPLDQSVPPEVLDGRAGQTVTEKGLGWDEALRIWSDVLAPATISIDHPAFLAYIPGAPTKASILFDLAISASSTYAGTWLEGGGAVWAENQALRWIADLAGFPEGAGGCFVSGGTSGNLSALVAARHTAAERRGGRPDRWMMACADSAHSSVASAANVMDVDVLRVETDADDRLTGSALRDSIDGATAERLFAVVGSAGSTNAGVIDDLSGIADVCAGLGVWFHVDGAYGGAALAAPSVRPRFNGIERADSFIVDPHKWLFAPFDACALLYRDPALARSAHTQHAAYLESLNLRGEWNPSDYAHHLTRRARGLPLWFSLATSGTDAYRDAVESVLSLAREAAEEIRRTPGLELLNDPDLTVLLFRREGWSGDEYETWWRRLLDDQIAFVQPTTWRGEKVARLCFVNPRTTIDHVRAILATMR